MGVRISPPVQISNIMNKIIQYISVSNTELKTNVTWTKWSEIQKYTVIVALFSTIFALATFGVDTAFEKIVKNIYSLLKS